MWCCTPSLPGDRALTLGSWTLCRSRGVVVAGGRVLPPPPRRRRRGCVLASCAREPVPGNSGLEMERRHLVLSGLLSSVVLILPISESYAVMETDDEDVKMATQVDEINAYSFLYPVELPGKKFNFKWVESRKPERYSSAAPLSPDARQRIVGERVDMINNVVISVSFKLEIFKLMYTVMFNIYLMQIGPPNSRFLPSKDKTMWDPKDVADCILADRSTMKVTTGQRMTESSVLDAHSTEAPEPNLFRHNVACTAERDGYLYSLNASTLSKQWESKKTLIIGRTCMSIKVSFFIAAIDQYLTFATQMGPYLKKTVESFRLLPPTENYVPPYKDPWRFW
ncbi:hypothetical protein PR202_ga10491 [Eleusine coracana subsp. coracana]|uniref:PsbP C-terminal domain-containing protein n=1 Tax=Eleusine coracana subsp. coracana TaxID=191504 RepID=A0AAV5C6X2_ELECO|nr:hypothetical protein PR202_ga10491 [Eleusine coracana subsp. coracana]